MSTTAFYSSLCFWLLMRLQWQQQPIYRPCQKVPLPLNNFAN